MAGEITATIQYRIAKSLYDSGLLRLPMTTFDQTTAGGGGPGYQTIGTTAENIAFGDIAPGLVVAYNLDATNYVELGYDQAATFVAAHLLKANRGSFAVFWVPAGKTLQGKANTASCNIMITGWNA